MKLFNKTIPQMDIQLYVKDEDGIDILVELRPEKILFTPTDEKTRSVNMHGVKRNITVYFEKKPDHLEYFKEYNEEDLIIPVEEVLVVPAEVLTGTDIGGGEFSHKEVIVEPVTTMEGTAISLQDMLMSNIKKAKESSEDLFEKTIEEIGSDEKELYSELDLSALKESVEDLVKKDSETKPKTKSKKGPGRPKKRGRKPAKKAPGRPLGSKNKKK